MRNRALEYARANSGITFRPTDQHLEDTGINTNEEVASGETDIDVTPDATTAIPVGTVIKIDSENMTVTATGNTLTVVRQDAVTHSTATDIYKLVQSCVLWLPGQDDPQSATIRDRSGYGNDGAITGATWAQTGQGLWLLDCDGTDDYVDCGSSSDFDFTSGDFSFEFWMQDNLVNITYPFGRYSHNVNGYRLELFTTGQFYFRTYQSGTSQASNTATSAISADTPTQIGITRSGTSVKILVNGVDATDTAGTHTDPVTRSGSLFFAAGAAGTSEITGRIGLIRAFKSELTASKMLGDFNQERHLLGV